MNTNFFELKRMGERSILINFDPNISSEGLEKLLIYKDAIKKYYAKVNVEVINTYCSLLITYLFDIENVYGEFSALKDVLKSTKIIKNRNITLFHIPVCYDLKFGIDLDLISTQKKLSLSEIISLHTTPIYTVYFIGFLPGFLYLGGLDKRLHISRKDEPRLKVEKGAVGIGENQTGIYPKESPGGWQIIGNSPVPLFDKNNDPPCEISAGDKVKFYPVTKEEYVEILEAIKSQKFQFKKEKYHV